MWVLGMLMFPVGWAWIPSQLWGEGPTRKLWEPSGGWREEGKTEVPLCFSLRKPGFRKPCDLMWAGDVRRHQKGMYTLTIQRQVGLQRAEGGERPLRKNLSSRTSRRGGRTPHLQAGAGSPPLGPFKSLSDRIRSYNCPSGMLRGHLSLLF